MNLSQQTLAYRLRVTIDLMGEEMERGPAMDTERMRGLLRLAQADALTLQSGRHMLATATGTGDHAKRPALRVVRGGRVD
jgi:hypothetical protein